MSNVIQTNSGRFLDPFDPKPEQINMRDGFLALARTPRFRGQTNGLRTYSVLEHSIKAMLLAEASSSRANVMLGAFLHDIGEWPFGDIPSPMKRHPAYAQIRTAEENFHDFILDFCGVSLTDDEVNLIARIDQYLLCVEAMALMGATPHGYWAPAFVGFDFLVEEFGDCITQNDIIGSVSGKDDSSDVEKADRATALLALAQATLIDTSKGGMS